MKTAPSTSANLVNVHGTELLAGDTRERYRQKLARITLDSMVQFVGLLDAKGTVLEINQVALDAVGIKLSDVEGKPFWTTFWWQVSEEINATLRESIRRAAQGEFVRWDTEIYGRAGGKETIIIDASLMPVTDEQGNVVFITAEGRDITEKKAHEREIARQREELAKLDELKTQFFANISHEFRTPLTLMLGPLEDASADGNEPLGARQRERITMVQRNGLRLQKLVNALLDFSRVEADRIQAVYQPTDLASLTHDLASSFRSACEKAGLTLTIDTPPLPEPVYVDHEMWEKIVLNLVSNAFKFTLDGGIRIELSAEDGHAVLRVSDTGTGIPESEVSRIFDRFHRVEGARGRTYEGTGIGLALAKQLIELHKGTVAVDSTFGKGTTLIVRVPFGHAHLPQDRLEAARTQASTATRAEAFVSEALRWLPDGMIVEELDPLPAPEQPSGARARVLLADDNADMRDYLARLLGVSYEVTTAADGEEALAAARRMRPDLVLTDVMMPRLDGFGLLQKLRSDGELRSVPVIVLSARAGEEAKVEGLQAGADDYLVKPFSARELLARVGANIELARTRSDSARLLREEAQTLDILNRVGTAVAAEIDLERAVQMVTDAATEVSGAAFGSFFYNVLDEKGEAYTLYTLSGAPREAFAKFPMPRNTAVFGPTFAGEGIVRSDDITADPRYGKNSPHRGMPQGHLPVRSYLAAPVVAPSGEVLGGLFFGHPDIGVFSERDERIVAAIAVQAGIAIDKARLYRAAQDEIERRKRIEATLRIGEEALEAKVAERTAQLAASNARLIAEAEEREKAEGRFGLLVAGVVDYALYMLDPNGVITSWNPGAERLKGYGTSEIIGSHYSRFFSEDDRAANLPGRALETAARVGKFEAEGWRVRKDGSRFWANVVLDAIRSQDGRLLGFAKITRDITERREAMLALQRTQEQLAQAQKMEGIGQLTGGVAHDFNNLLTIIIGNIETLQRVLQGPTVDAPRLLKSAENAMRGAQRAAALTQRLLAFSRQQPLDPKVLEVSKLVAGLSDLLRRALGEEIEIETILARALWNVHIDPNQLEVAILNLAVNARDAMPDGGKVTIETANAYVDESDAAGPADVPTGEYVVIGIKDTGSGMSREVAERAFEPFFTTKELGQGTGLGLSQVYGFVRQSGGHVRIDTEIGRGTTVSIYLPRLLAAEEVAAAPEAALPPARSRGSETILVVEDDHDVRVHTRGILHELGYLTLEAGTGEAALQMLHAHPEIRLLLTDVGLPGGMNGRQLADEARRHRQGLRVLMATGYSRDAIVRDGRLAPGVHLITKPFSYAGLASKLRDILEQSSRPPRVLLVEDEMLIQLTTIDQLEELGFESETAGSATEALNKLKHVDGDVDAAIVDVGLPDWKGDVLVTEIRAMYPAMPIVIASGYGEDTLRVLFRNDAHIAFLTKPYSAEQLRTALGSLDVESAPKGLRQTPE